MYAGVGSKYNGYVITCTVLVSHSYIARLIGNQLNIDFYILKAKTTPTARDAYLSLVYFII